MFARLVLVGHFAQRARKLSREAIGSSRVRLSAELQTAGRCAPYGVMVGARARAHSFIGGLLSPRMIQRRASAYQVDVFSL
jgi:hypothetical protein